MYLDCICVPVCVCVHVSGRGYALRGFIRRQIVLSGGGFFHSFLGNRLGGNSHTYLFSCACSCSIVHAVPRTRDPFFPSFLPFLPYLLTKADGDDDYDGGCTGFIKQCSSASKQAVLVRGVKREETCLPLVFLYFPSIR